MSTHGPNAMVSHAALPLDVAILVLGATVAGFIARRSGQPTIIAYLVAGVVLGPIGLGVVQVSELTETLSELGLAFLLFLLGIKMRLDDVRHLIGPILKISLPQLVAVATIGTAVALVLGFGTIQAAFIGLAVAYSSTAVVLKLLTDNRETEALHGRLDVGVLLVQDVAVVVLLAVLAAGRPDSATQVVTTLAVVLALVAVIAAAAVLASKYALPAIFSRIADNEEVFLLVALSWAFLFVFVAEEIDLILGPLGIEAYLSVEMGAFLAGLAIAQLPYSKELQDRVNPLTDLFVMLFFAAVALSLDASDLLFHWEAAVVAAAVLMLAKFLIFFPLLTWQRFDVEASFLGSLYMVQVSEFAIVVGVAGVQGGFIGVEVLGFLTLVALLTMSASVYLIEFRDTLLARMRPYLHRLEASETMTAQRREYAGHAVVIGYDDVTRHLLGYLDEHFEDIVVVDRREDHVAELAEADHDALFGDIGRSTIREAVGLERAAFVLSSSDQPEIGLTILEETPDDATVILEAIDAADARDLYDAGATYVIRTVHLAGDRLTAYLAARLDHPAAFEDAIERDVGILRSPEPFPNVHERMARELDD